MGLRRAHDLPPGGPHLPTPHLPPHLAPTWPAASAGDPTSRGTHGVGRLGTAGHGPAGQAAASPTLDRCEFWLACSSVHLVNPTTPLNLQSLQSSGCQLAPGRGLLCPLMSTLHVLPQATLHQLAGERGHPAFGAPPCPCEGHGGLRSAATATSTCTDSGSLFDLYGGFPKLTGPGEMLKGCGGSRSFPGVRKRPCTSLGSSGGSKAAFQAVKTHERGKTDPDSPLAVHRTPRRTAWELLQSHGAAAGSRLP